MKFRTTIRAIAGTYVSPDYDVPEEAVNFAMRRVFCSAEVRAECLKYLNEGESAWYASGHIIVEIQPVEA